MTSVEIIAQVIGILGIVVFTACFHFNTMKNVLKVKLLVDMIWGTHYFLLGAYSGFAINAVCCIREIVFMNRDKKFFRSRAWIYVFVALNIIGAILTWSGLYSIFPCVASILATVSFSRAKVQISRKMVGEALAFASVMIAMVRNRSQKC